MHEYDLPVHRYRELKHFCLQYNDMKEALKKLSHEGIGNPKEDTTADVAVLRADYIYATELIERTAYDTENSLGDTILKTVTNDLGLSLVEPDDKINFERLLHKFYYLLSERKGV